MQGEMGIVIPDEEYAALGRMLANADSPVGIDAKKTHIIIIHKLLQLEKRIARLEARQ